MAPEAPLEQTDHGLAPRADGGWFVLNAREARWRDRPGRGKSLPLTGWSDEECETYFAQLGVAVLVLEPGEPIGMYHWEADAEGFLVLSGEGLLIVEGEERPLCQWDYFHSRRLPRRLAPRVATTRRARCRSAGSRPTSLRRPGRCSRRSSCRWRGPAAGRPGPGRASPCPAWAGEPPGGAGRPRGARSGT